MVIDAIRLMKEKNVTDVVSRNILFSILAEIDNPEYLKLYIKIMEPSNFSEIVKETDFPGWCVDFNSSNILRFLYDEKIDISSFLLSPPRKGV